MTVPDSVREKRPNPSAAGNPEIEYPMAAFQNDPPEDVPEVLTARAPFDYEVISPPTLNDAGAAISGRSVVVRDVPIVGLPDREESESCTRPEHRLKDG